MDNVLQTTTVGASVNQFFDSEAQEAMERQLQHNSLCSNTQNTLCGLLKASSEASVSTLRPFDNHPLVYQALQHLVQHFWPWRLLNKTTSADGGRYWCLSTLLGSRAIQLREAFCQLLADGPIVWKRNLFKSCAQFLNCPWPKKYADCVLQEIQPDESILQWYQEIH
ncbi:hypothetical protein P9112_004251 [Eukaryota sp. TZLM1-RC]